MNFPRFFSYRLCSTSSRVWCFPLRKLFATVAPALLVLALAVPVQAAPVDVNTADAATLAESLNGVGPSIAAAIVGYREQNGPFKTIEDLLNVKGIGPKVLERNRQDIKLKKAESSARAGKLK